MVLSQTFLVLWLVLTYDLLQHRRIDNIIITNISPSPVWNSRKFWKLLDILPISFCFKLSKKVLSRLIMNRYEKQEEEKSTLEQSQSSETKQNTKERESLGSKLGLTFAMVTTKASPKQRILPKTE